MTSMSSAPSNRWLVLVIVCLAQFMVVLDATVVNVALPSIQRGLHFSQADLQWVINAYTLLFGRRPPREERWWPTTSRSKPCSWA
jgi:predicted MFS family arabinose efflux permease